MNMQKEKKKTRQQEGMDPHVMRSNLYIVRQSTTKPSTVLPCGMTASEFAHEYLKRITCKQDEKPPPKRNKKKTPL